MLSPVRLLDGTLPVRPPGADSTGSTAPLQYGFGIRTETQNGRRFVLHTGGIDGFEAQSGSYPNQRISIAAIINSGRTENDDGRNAAPIQAVFEEAARIGFG